MPSQKPTTGGDKGPPAHVCRLFHRRQQQAPDGSRHHDTRRKAGERTLNQVAQAVPHKKDTGRAQRCPSEGDQQPFPQFNRHILLQSYRSGFL